MTNPNTIIYTEYGPLIVNINDTIILRSIITLGYWAKEDLDLIKDLINFLHSKKTGAQLVIYDVGANIGTHSLAISKIYGDKVRIRAFEAQREFFHMFCGSIALNGLRNIYLHHNAVSDESNTIINFSPPNYSLPNNFGGFEVTPPVRSDNNSMSKEGNDSVSTVTIDHFNEDVDFMKIDIEGMEDKAIRGAMNTLKKARPICFIEIIKCNTQSLFQTFTSLGYFGFQKGTDVVAIPIEHGIVIKNLHRIF